MCSRIYTTCIPVKNVLCPAKKLLPSFSQCLMIRNAIVTTAHLMPRRAPLRADSLPVLLLAATTNFHYASSSFCNVLLKPSYHCECTGDPPCLLRASDSNHLTFSPWFGPDGTAGEHFVKQGQTGGIFWPKLAVTFTFLGVVVEPGMKLAAAAVAWEAATKKKIASAWEAATKKKDS